MCMEKQGVVTDATPKESEKIAEVVDAGVKAFEAKEECTGKKCSACEKARAAREAARAEVKSN